VVPHRGANPGTAAGGDAKVAANQRVVAKPFGQGDEIGKDGVVVAVGAALVAPRKGVQAGVDQGDALYA
jgi:hypothetical protein